MFIQRSAHVRDVGLLGAEDRRIWAFAAENDFLVTSKDSDFYQRSIAFGAPPKVIWLRVGNVPTTAVADLLRQRYVVIRRFYDDPAATFLSLTPS